MLTANATATTIMASSPVMASKAPAMAPPSSKSQLAFTLTGEQLAIMKPRPLSKQMPAFDLYLLDLVCKVTDDDLKRCKGRPCEILRAGLPGSGGDPNRIYFNGEIIVGEDGVKQVKLLDVREGAVPMITMIQGVRVPGQQVGNPAGLPDGMTSIMKINLEPGSPYMDDQVCCELRQRKMHLVSKFDGRNKEVVVALAPLSYTEPPRHASPPQATKTVTFADFLNKQRFSHALSYSVQPPSALASPPTRRQHASW